MADVNTLSDRIYIITLRIIQPARVQDIFEKMVDIFGDAILEKVSRGDIYNSHKMMKKQSGVIKVRKGTYCLSATTWSYARKLIKKHKLDNKRFFLLKKERKAYKR